MNTRQNPQAFPAAGPSIENGGDFSPGMDLRDWFAGQALTAVVRQCANDTLDPQDHSRAALFARRSYEIADAMLEARAKGGA